MKCYIRNIALYYIQTLTVQKVDQSNRDNFEMRCWRRMEIVWLINKYNR